MQVPVWISMEWPLPLRAPWAARLFQAVIVALNCRAQVFPARDSGLHIRDLAWLQLCVRISRSEYDCWNALRGASETGCEAVAPGVGAVYFQSHAAHWDEDGFTIGKDLTDYEMFATVPELSPPFPLASQSFKEMRPAIKQTITVSNASSAALSKLFLRMWTALAPETVAPTSRLQTDCWQQKWSIRQSG